MCLEGLLMVAAPYLKANKMKLYCKKAFEQFKVGDQLPDVDTRVGMKLVEKGLATATKPKAKAKKKTNVKSK